jgi:hypothetical protein
MTPKRALLIQTLLEAALPLLGYFYWNWDTSFILMFYWLDWALFLGINTAKAKKRLEYSGRPSEKKEAIRHLSIGFLTFLGTSLLVYFTLPILTIDFDWKERMISFLTYKDIGVQQGIILIPLVLLNGIVIYKQQFIRPQLYARMEMRSIISETSKQGYLLLGAAAFFFGLALVVSFPAEIMLFIAIGGTTLYRFLRRQ